MNTKPLTARRASAALRKAGVSVQQCSTAYTGRDLDVLCFPSTDVDAVTKALTDQGWVNVRALAPSPGFRLMCADLPEED